MRRCASHSSAMPSCGSIWVVYGLPVQAQRFDEVLRERRPVDFGIGGHVRVVVADRAIDLAGHRRPRAAAPLALQTRDDVGQFLADGGRARRSGRGCARASAGRRVRAPSSRSFSISCVELRQQHLLARLGQHQRVGQVVDVLARCRRNARTRAPAAELGIVAQSLLDEVLDRLDVVIGGALDLLDPRRVGDR